MTKRYDLTGMTFGRLTVVEYSETRKGGVAYWKCKCSCGNEHIVSANNLRTGQVTSCGCYRRETVSRNNTTHGRRKHPLYQIWKDMKGRCYCNSSQSYHNYGGRGIIMCDEWKNDFLAFFEWAIRNGWMEGLSIERIDVNGNYEPSNCKWIPLEQQCKNKRTTRLLTYNGKTQCCSDWSKELGIPAPTICWRLKQGYSVDEILRKN